MATLPTFTFLEFAVVAIASCAPLARYAISVSISSDVHIHCCAFTARFRSQDTRRCYRDTCLMHWRLVLLEYHACPFTTAYDWRAI